MTAIEQVVWTAQRIGETAHLIVQALGRGDADSVTDCCSMIEAWAGELGYDPNATAHAEDTQED